MHELGKVLVLHPISLADPTRVPVFQSHSVQAGADHCHLANSGWFLESFFDRVLFLYGSIPTSTNCGVQSFFSFRMRATVPERVKLRLHRPSRYAQLFQADLLENCSRRGRDCLT